MCTDTTTPAHPPRRVGPGMVARVGSADACWIAAESLLTDRYVPGNPASRGVTGRNLKDFCAPDAGGYRRTRRPGGASVGKRRSRWTRPLAAAVWSVQPSRPWCQRPHRQRPPAARPPRPALPTVSQPVHLHGSLTRRSPRLERPIDLLVADVNPLCAHPCIAIPRGFRGCGPEAGDSRGPRRLRRFRAGTDTMERMSVAGVRRRGRSLSILLPLDRRGQLLVARFHTSSRARARWVVGIA